MTYVRRFRIILDDIKQEIIILTEDCKIFSNSGFQTDWSVVKEGHFSMTEYDIYTLNNPINIVKLGSVQM